MSERLEAWLGFTDGKCNEDTQLLIDDIKCLVENLQATEEENKILREAVESLDWCNQTCKHCQKVVEQALEKLKESER